MQLHRLRSALLVCVVFGLACDDATGPAVPASIAIAAGNGQNGAAGTPLAAPPAVRVLDARDAPLRGVAVRFTVTAGDGSVEHASATTGGDGIATAGAWTLGPRVGTNVLTASVDGLAPVTFTATSAPGSPALLEPFAGDAQAAPVGTRLPVEPAVLATDAFGNPTPGVPVRFAAPTPGGRIGLSIAATDEQGVARAGAWTLDTLAGPQTLRASLDGGATLDLIATGLPLTPVAFERASPAHQTGTVAEPADAPPVVVPRDRYRNAVPGTAVRFVVLAGGGSLHAADASEAGTDTVSVQSDTEGRAALPRWTFGTRAGLQRLRADIAGDTVRAVFTAEALPGPPTGLVVLRGQDQSAPAGTIVARAPAVSVADAYDNPIAGLPVTFTVSAGGGIVNLGETRTDDDGEAAPLSWILGRAPGPNSLVATAAGVPDVLFNATATEGEPFEFDFFFINAPQELQDAMRAAAARWEGALLAGQPDAEGSIPAPFCGPIDQSGPFDDLRLILLVDSIDGPGKVLASAGPCAVRSNSRMPVVGGVQLDAADVDNLTARGQLVDVLVHEIGHILGIGTRWGGGLLVGGDGDDPWFAGSAARAAFEELGGAAYGGFSVPVENTGGAGTRNGHWRESVFRNELMTGFINTGANPLSSVSLASLQDIGYLVDIGPADFWSYSAALSAQSADAAPRTPLIERAWPRDPIELPVKR